MIVSIQSYGDDLVRFHPHLHCLVSDGLFLPDGSFLPVPAPDPEALMLAFRHRLLKALLARYILHAPFSQERITYDRSARTIACVSKKNNGDSKNTRGGVTVSPALDWLAALITHLPDKGQQLVRFYGRYSNVCQGRKKRAAGPAVQPVDQQTQDEDHLFRKQCRSNWARLIKKILEVDPLVCPKCHGRMTIISFLDDPAVVKRILAHLNLWEVPERSPPPASPPRDFIYDPDFFGGLVN